MRQRKGKVRPKQMQLSRQERRAAERKARKSELKSQAKNPVAPSLADLPCLDDLSMEELHNLDPVIFNAALDRQEAEAEEDHRRLEKLAQSIMAKREAAAAAQLKEPPSARDRANQNRINAQHSTGPRTVEGKSISSENSLQHGLYSKRRFLPGEDPAQWEHVLHALLREHLPVNHTEVILVEELAEHHWRILRYRRIEHNILAEDNCTINRITAAQRFLNSAERSFYRTLKALRDLQKARGFVPQQIFASSCTKETACTDDAVSQGSEASAGHKVSAGRTATAGFVPTKSTHSPTASPATGTSNGPVHPESPLKQAA